VFIEAGLTRKAALLTTMGMLAPQKPDAHMQFLTRRNPFPPVQTRRWSFVTWLEIESFAKDSEAPLELLTISDPIQTKNVMCNFYYAICLLR